MERKKPMQFWAKLPLSLSWIYPGSEIESLPERIGQLTNLQTLNLSGSSAYSMKLEVLPKRFTELTNLTTLYLDFTPAGRNMPAALKAQLEAQGCKGNGW